MRGPRSVVPRRGRTLVVLALVGVAVAVAIVVLLLARDGTGSAPASPGSPSATMPLTGMPTDEVPRRPAVLVKVSNSPEARPQTGLDQADLVFEALTEGGTTRFMAVFHSTLPEVVGPVRSARPVDAQLVAGFDHPGFAYSGARAEVRALLSAAPAVSLTEGAPGFFRDRGEYASRPVAPHDLFVELAPVLAAVTERGAQPLRDPGWSFTTTPPPEAHGPAGDVDVALSRSSTTSWRYDQDQQVYRRSQNSVPSAVTGTGMIGAANVVVLDTRHDVGPSGYPETDVLGGGAAWIARDGLVFEARWSKPSPTDPLMLLQADGTTPFPLHPGPTWIHLADDAALPSGTADPA